MAIGDAVAAILGTGTVNRQPSAGVEEQISCVIKNGGADASLLYDGSQSMVLLNTALRTDEDIVHALQLHAQAYNMAVMITNSVYYRKPGTTDLFYIGGVQTNA